MARKVTREKLIRTFRWNAKVISWSSALIQAVDSFRYRDDSRIIRLSKQQAGGRAVVSPDNGSAERRRQKEKKNLTGRVTFRRRRLLRQQDQHHTTSILSVGCRRLNIAHQSAISNRAAAANASRSASAAVQAPSEVYSGRNQRSRRRPLMPIVFK